MDTDDRDDRVTEHASHDPQPALPGPGRLRRVLEHPLLTSVDQVFLDDLLAIRYLTGFSGSAGTCLLDVAEATVLLRTDGRYLAQAEEEAERHGVGLSLTSLELLAPTGPVARHDHGVRRIGVDLATLTLAHARRLDDLGVELIDVGPALRATRAVKDATERAAISEAARIADRAMDRVLEQLEPGVTELEVAGYFELVLRQLGAHATSFPTIVAFGARTAFPHAQPTTRRLVEGDAVVVDFGVEVDGYRSDATRALVVGPPPPGWEETRALVAAAKEAGVARVRPGGAACEVEEAARQVLRDAGREAELLHSIGHGVGLEIHEDPFTRDTSQELLANMCVTVEPGLYQHGVFGVRLEDLYLVTPDGAVPLSGTGARSSTDVPGTAAN